ncbi:hypothetical protein AAHB94_31090 [Bacillus toyonensis]
MRQIWGSKIYLHKRRQAFESVIKQGIFSFDLNGEVQEIKAGASLVLIILIK